VLTVLYVKTAESSAPAATSPAVDFPIAIIGSGFAGIGIESFTIFERAAEIGGTWRDNTYPGAACDVPSHLYSLSFEPNPDWSHMYSGSNEIQAYLLRLVEKHDLRRHLHVNTAIVEARFDEGEGIWTLRTSAGETVRARAVVAGVGGLIDPRLPDIAGLESFAGKVIHTARWDHEYDLAGKHVAVIGTGASAIQVVPSIAPIVGKLSVFQRTAAWVVPKKDFAFSARVQRLFRRFPLLMKLHRFLIFALTEWIGPRIFLDWAWLKRRAERYSLRHLDACVKDPALKAKLTPTYRFGCKRVLISDDYWPAFERPNVELVTDAIREIRPHSVVTVDGREHPVDAIVLATGFALNIGAAPFPVYGRGGRSLAQVWGPGAVAYKGMTVAGFPNWFVMMGPNTGPGHTSVLVYTEAQISYTLQAIRRMIADPSIRYVDVRQDVQDAYNRGLQGRMKHMVWSTGCSSWYLSPSGENHSLYPGLASEYVLRARTFKPSEYDEARA
jgi:cation diffusion facilitator CzcD-associated flavoprotein CzcO